MNKQQTVIIKPLKMYRTYTTENKEIIFKN